MKENSETLAIYAECIDDALGLSPTRILEKYDQDIAQVKKGSLNLPGAQSLTRYRAFMVEIQALQQRDRLPGSALRELLLTRARELIAQRSLEQITYNDVKGNDELRVFYKFLQWHRKGRYPFR